MPILPNPKHELFAQELAKGAPVAESYVTAGFSHNPGNARRLRASEAVLKRVEALLREREHIHAKAVEVAIEKTGITIGRVLEELAKIGFANIADYVDVSTGEPRINLADVPPDKLAAISSIETETQLRGDSEDGVRKVKIRLWDKRAALVDMGKHLGMFIERSEVKHTLTLEQLVLQAREIRENRAKLSNPPTENGAA
jgi:phage terminase small subunit